MKDKVFEKVTEYIDAIAAKLGVAAEHVYGLMVRQQIAEGIVYTIVLTLFLIALIFVSLKVYKSYKNCDRYDDEPQLMALFFLIAGTVIMTIVWVVLVPDYFMQIINPEYYAIKEIIEAVGGK